MKTAIAERRAERAIGGSPRSANRAAVLAATALAVAGLGGVVGRAGIAAPASAEVKSQAEALVPRIQGRWRVMIELSSGRCRWRGFVELRQRGRRITGRGSARPARKARRCPVLAGKIRGHITGARIGFGFPTGALGRADFEGRLDSRTGTMRGSWNARSRGGSWRAEQAGSL